MTHTRVLHRLRALVLLFAMLFCDTGNAAADAAVFTVFTAEIPPYSISYNADNLEIHGLIGEIVTGALRKAGLERKLRISWLPWKRAQLEAQSTPNSLIFPLTRTAERERIYKWIKLVITSPCSAYAVEPLPKMGTLEEVKQLHVGAFAGSPAHAELIKLFGPDAEKNLWAINDETANYRKLLLHRIDAWITQDVVAAYVSKSVSGGRRPAAPPLIKGYTLFEQPIWVGTSLDTSDDNIALIRKALDNFMTTPEYRAILRAYEAKP